MVSRILWGLFEIAPPNSPNSPRTPWVEASRRVRIHRPNYLEWEPYFSHNKPKGAESTGLRI